MVRGALPLALGAVVLAALFLILVGGMNEETLAAEELPPPTLLAGAEEMERLAMPVGDPAAMVRSGIAPILPAADVAADRLPSFRGRLLLPDGSPASGARIVAYGMPGWAMAVDTEDPRTTPVVSWELKAGDDGRFLIPEVEREGLRFLLHATAAPFPVLELVNLPATMGRTRDLGDLRFHDGFNLKGRVVDKQGRAVAQVLIRPLPEPDSASSSQWLRDRLQPIEGYEARSDSEGRFRLDGLPPGRIRLQAEAKQYATSLSDTITGRDGADLTAITVVMEPSLPLMGTVLDESQRPIAGAQLRVETSAGERVTGRSAEDGTFRLDVPLHAEQIHLRVAASGFRSLKRSLSGVDRSQLQHLVLQPLDPVRGVVVDEHHRPVEGAQVVLLEARRVRILHTESPHSIPALASARTGADGRFDFEVDLRQTWAREFLVAAWTDEHAPAYSTTVNLRAGAPAVPNLEVQLEPGLLIFGKVFGPEHQPLPGARLTLRLLTSPRERPGRSVRVPDTRRRGTLYRTGRSDAEGLFRFGGLPVGDYRVEALYPGLSPAESKEIALLSGPVEAVVSLPHSSGIRGQLVGDFNEFHTLRATAMTAGSDPLDTIVDPDGGFLFPDLRPGSYQVIIHEVEPGFSEMIFHYGGGEGLARADAVEVAPGQTTEVTLELDMTGLSTLTGSVTVNGEPSNRVTLYLLPRGVGSSAEDPRLAQKALLSKLRSTSANQVGDYRLAGVEPGDYWLVAERTGILPRGIFRYGEGAHGGPTGLQRVPLSLNPGETYRKDLALRVGRLEGRALRSKDGNLVPVTDGAGSIRSVDSGQGVGGRSFTLLPSGSFAVEWAPEGEFLLTIRGRQYEIVDEPVQIQTGEPTRIELVLQPRKDSSPRPIQ